MLKPMVERMGELMGKKIKCVPNCKTMDEVKGFVGTMVLIFVKA